MKASNLGVVFGPSLMKPETESVYGITQIKYQNLVGEGASTVAPPLLTLADS